jgi:hypothetical protein
VTAYAHPRYAADASSNEAALLVTRTNTLEAELTSRVLFFNIWYKKKINPDDASRPMDSVSPHYESCLYVLKTQYLYYTSYLSMATTSGKKNKSSRSNNQLIRHKHDVNSKSKKTIVYDRLICYLPYSVVESLDVDHFLSF